ncbi:glycerate kinase, partial [Halobacterium sp. PCN9]|nr:glycerate kinase [Halobacterium bonnevillei]
MRIRDRSRLAGTPARSTAIACVEAGIDAARPGSALADQVAIDGDCLHVVEECYDLAAHD